MEETLTSNSPKLALLLLLASCRNESATTAPLDEPAPTIAETAAKNAAPIPWGLCGDQPRTVSIDEGLELLALTPNIAPAVDSPQNCLLVLRADPKLFDVVVGTAGEEAFLPAPRWAKKSGTVAVINASMFHEGGASTGMLVANGKALVAKENAKFGAFFASGPKSEAFPAATIWGRGCAGSSIDKLRRSYKTIIQNYRLLDCEGKPIAWKDEKVYSAAAVAIDRDDRILFVHLRAPHRMSTFTKILTDPAHNLRLRAAMYVEGGPEATLYVRNNEREAVFVGSYESEFLENHDNQSPWPLPNVLMLRKRKAL